MTAVSLVGFLIVANVAIMAGGIIWTKRQVKRVAAERAAAFRGLFALEPLPLPGDEVQILVDDESGMPAEIEAVHWPYLGWVDAVTLLKVDDKVLGWCRHLFRERRQAASQFSRARRWPPSSSGTAAALVATRAD